MSPSLWGGRDEREGLAAVRRIREEYKEAKGNVANILNTCTPTPTHKRTSFSMPEFEDKGQSCSLSLRLVFTVFTECMHIIAQYVRTELPHWIYNTRNVVMRYDKRGTQCKSLWEEWRWSRYCIIAAIPVVTPALSWPRKLFGKINVSSQRPNNVLYFSTTYTGWMFFSGRKHLPKIFHFPSEHFQIEKP